MRTCWSCFKADSLGGKTPSLCLVYNSYVCKGYSLAEANTDRHIGQVDPMQGTKVHPAPEVQTCPLVIFSTNSKAPW
jgi:hypothetical protein